MRLALMARLLVFALLWLTLSSTPAGAVSAVTSVSFDLQGQAGEHTFIIDQFGTASGPVKLTIHQRTSLPLGGSVSVLIDGAWQDFVFGAPAAACTWRQEVVFITEAEWNAALAASGAVWVELVPQPSAGACVGVGGAYLEVEFNENGDFDGDGETVGDGDCNDNDPTIFSSAVETCNGIDDNCDGLIDEGFDNDGDDYSACGGDCNDFNPNINPGASEDCTNGIDDNCDGLFDMGVDQDGDGQTDCGGDCDDQDPSVNASAPELCDGQDNNCGRGAFQPGDIVITTVDEGCAGSCDVLLIDDDDDDPDGFSRWAEALNSFGYSWSWASAGPGGDDGPSAGVMAAFDAVIWFSGDKFGPPGQPQAGPSANDEIELAAYLDLGGSLLISSQDWYADLGQVQTPLMTDYLGVGSIVNDQGVNGTMHGVAGSPFSAPWIGGLTITQPGNFFYFNDLVNPSPDALLAWESSTGEPTGISYEDPAAGFRSVFLAFPWEVLHEGDNAQAAAALDAMLLWLQGDCGADIDQDGDGSLSSEDCDDNDPLRSPDFVETCGDDIDNDCNGLVDSDDPATESFTWWQDSDGDGAGDPFSLPLTECAQPVGFVLNADDCDDNDPNFAPTVGEICGDGIDQDCDGSDALDSDGDGQCDSEDPCPADPFNDSDSDGVCNIDDVCPGLDDATFTAPMGSFTLTQPNTGQLVKAAGDIDGDGFDDFVIGADGLIGVYRGSALGPVLTTQLLPQDGSGPGFGSLFETGADLDDDGYNDLVIGDPGYDVATLADTGRVLIHKGLGTGSFAPGPSYLLVGSTAGERIGSQLAMRGDLDGDGIADLVVASSAGGGTLRLHAGSGTGPTAIPFRAYTLSVDDSLVLDIAPDINGDGIADLLVASASTDKLWAVMSPLPSSGPLDAAASLILPGAPGSGFGVSARGTGDLDGDGFGDLAIGSLDPAGTGNLLFLHGSASGPVVTPILAQISGAFAGDQLAYLADPADYDGDGDLDVAVGAPGTVPGGAAYVFRGPLAMVANPGSAAWSTDGIVGPILNPASGAVGATLASVGDVDGDGDQDLLVGAPRQQLSAGGPGQALLFDISSVLADMDGDGFPDLCDPCPDDPSTDQDGDGFCGSLDCDDTNPNIFPGAVEICDDIDNDCNGVLGPDELDNDGDSYSECDGDCDDGTVLIYPGAEEICDGQDSDCDGQLGADEVDGDNDGWVQCLDCDDFDAQINPDAAEVCDDRDDNCDGTLGVDELDNDGDGFTACDGDCDDGSPLFHPEAADFCEDGIDQNCDGSDSTCGGQDDDDGPDTGWCGLGEVEDSDGDGADCLTDCDDSDPNVNPTMPSTTCDLHPDTNCDGVLDVEVRCGGCGSSSIAATSAPPGGAPWWLALIGLVLLRSRPLRRRRC